MKRAERVLIAFDVFWNVVTGGHTGVCISSRAYIEYGTARRWTWLYHILDRISPGHCESSVINDSARCQEALMYLHSGPELGVLFHAFDKE